MNKKNIVWVRPNGGISITNLADDAADSKDFSASMRSDDFVPVMFDISDEDIPDIIAHNDLRFNGKKLICDIDSAKESTKARLREERKPLIAALDIPFMRALEDGERIDYIVKEKKRLRDITKLADSAKDLKSLRALSVSK